jgi:hypothetical protein
MAWHNTFTGPPLDVASAAQPHLVAAARARRVRESERESTDVGPAVATNKKKYYNSQTKKSN